MRQAGINMKATKLSIMVALVGIVVGCTESANPLLSEQSSNKDIMVDKLFEYDGCLVYRFFDQGRHHYFVKCAYGSSTKQLISCGKNCIYAEEIETVKTQE
jgi:hypothetical protein